MSNQNSISTIKISKITCFTSESVVLLNNYIVVHCFETIKLISYPIVVQNGTSWQFCNPLSLSTGILIGIHFRNIVLITIHIDIISITTTFLSTHLLSKYNEHLTSKYNEHLTQYTNN